MDIILTDVQNRLTEKVTALKYVDEDWGQLDDYSPNFPVKWPCALVDCFSASYENMGNKVQMGLCTIRVIIAGVKLSNSSAQAPVNQKEKSLSFYVLMKDVYKALHGFTGHNHYSALIRISERRLPRNDGVRAHEMLFTVEIKDIQAKPQKITVASNSVNLNIETQTNLSPEGIGVEILESQFDVS
jgi:hypothetical protein